MDPDKHSFSLLDPDPGGENLRENQKIARKMEENCNFYCKILTKCGQTPLFITVEQSFWSISTHHKFVTNFVWPDPDQHFLGR